MGSFAEKGDRAMCSRCLAIMWAVSAVDRIHSTQRRSKARSSCEFVGNLNVKFEFLGPKVKPDGHLNETISARLTKCMYRRFVLSFFNFG